MTVRPTIRCLRGDLRLTLPPINVPLDEIDHPLLKKANEQFAAPTGPRERIRSIDDVVLFKVKVQRWRGAVHDARDPSWLVAAGLREDGSRDDFYEALATAVKAARTRYNAEHDASLNSETYCQSWLPDDDDHERYRAEAGVRLVRELRFIVHQLVHSSLLDGREHTAEVVGAELGLFVQAAEDHATYVALRIVGSVPDMPHRPLAPGEQVYSNYMDPSAAAKLLEDHDAG
jgi:hypothetical protein